VGDPHAPRSGCACPRGTSIDIQLLQIGDDPLHRPLSDPYAFCHVAQANPGRLRDAEQHVGVVAEEGPVGAARHFLSLLALYPLIADPLYDKAFATEMS